MPKMFSFYIYFIMCLEINGHSHGHHTSHTTSYTSNNNNNEESYNMKPKYRIIGNNNNNIIEDSTFKHFINSFLEKDEYYSIIVNYYVTNIILESSDYYGECLMFNSQITENITIINIKNIINYDELISYNDYKNNSIFNNMNDYCVKYQTDYSNDKSILMGLFVFLILICIFTGCCNFIGDSSNRNNLY